MRRDKKKRLQRAEANSSFESRPELRSVDAGLTKLKLKGEASLGALKQELSRMDGQQSLATTDLGSDAESNVRGIEKLLAKISLVIGFCESALKSDDPEAIKGNIRDAKKCYADALRCAGQLSFSVEDVEAFEFRTVRLEEVILQLERRWMFQNSEALRGHRQKE
jgi:hypothetical protein